MTISIMKGLSQICHPSCETCLLDSDSDDENSCTSCHPQEYQFSPYPEDLVFKCTNSCDVYAPERVIGENGYYYCDSVLVNLATTENPIISTTETFPSKTLPLQKFNYMTIHIDTDHITIITIFVIFVVVGILIIFLVILFYKRKRNNHIRKADYYKVPNIVVVPDIIIKDNEHEDQVENLIPIKEEKRCIKIPKENLIKPYTGLEEIKITDFTKIKLIGGGNYSEVYHGTLRDEAVALKIAGRNGRKSIHKELQIYRKISHQHIVPALGIHLGVENILFLKLRTCNLTEHFNLYRNTLDFGQLKRYCVQTADAMRYLHKNEILHCDLKIDNILMKDDKGEEIEISDFGCAIDFTYDCDIKFLGTQTHMAYEMLKKTQDANFAATPTNACDVWSFAVTSWQIFQKTFELPLNFCSREDIIKNYETGKKLPVPAMISPKLWDFIFIQCFDLDPGSRPTMENLYNMLMNPKLHENFFV